MKRVTIQQDDGRHCAHCGKPIGDYEAMVHVQDTSNLAADLPLLQMSAKDIAMARLVEAYHADCWRAFMIPK